MNHASSPVLGVIGGLGPMATVRFMELIVRMTQADTDQQHLDMIVYNTPSTPDRTGFLLGTSQESPLPHLLKAGQALVRDGASCIALPCITAHAFLPQLEQTLGVPVIDGVGETADCLARRGITCAGILATDGTLQTHILHNVLRSRGITPVTPDARAQAGVMELIYGQIKADRPRDMALFHAAADSLRTQGAQTVILGCTELSLLTDTAGCTDVLRLLARRALTLCGKPIKD